MTSSSDKMYRRALKYAKAYHLAAFGVAYATNRRNAYRRLRAADRVCRILRGEPAFASWVGDSSAAAAVKTRVWYEVRRTNIKTARLSTGTVATRGTVSAARSTVATTLSCGCGTSALAPITPAPRCGSSSSRSRGDGCRSDAAARCHRGHEASHHG